MKKLLLIFLIFGILLVALAMAKEKSATTGFISWAETFIPVNQSMVNAPPAKKARKRKIWKMKVTYKDEPDSSSSREGDLNKP